MPYVLPYVSDRITYKYINKYCIILYYNDNDDIISVVNYVYMI